MQWRRCVAAKVSPAMLPIPVCEMVFQNSSPPAGLYIYRADIGKSRLQEESVLQFDGRVSSLFKSTVAWIRSIYIPGSDRGRTDLGYTEGEDGNGL